MNEPSEDRNPTDACPVTPESVLECIAELRATTEQIRAEREENYRKFEEGVEDVQVVMHAFQRNMNKRALRHLAINLVAFICASAGSLGVVMAAWRST